MVKKSHIYIYFTSFTTIYFRTCGVSAGSHKLRHISTNTPVILQVSGIFETKTSLPKTGLEYGRVAWIDSALPLTPGEGGTFERLFFKHMFMGEKILW